MSPLGAEGEDVPKEEGGETTEGEEKQEKEEKRERRPKGSRRKRYEGTYEPVLIRDSVNNFFLLCKDRLYHFFHSRSKKFRSLSL